MNFSEYHEKEPKVCLLEENRSINEESSGHTMKVALINVRKYVAMQFLLSLQASISVVVRASFEDFIRTSEIVAASS